MTERIPDALRRILTEQYDGDQLNKVVAQIFQGGASVVFYPNGAKEILPEVTVEIGIYDCRPGENENLLPVQTPPREWDRLLARPPKETEIAVFPGNFREGAQGKHDENTWRRDDFTNDDAPIRRGHEGRGHRGGMRHANSRPVLLKLLRQNPGTKKYR